MKTICAWCGSTISVNCDHCGAPLAPTTTLGASLPFAERDALVCLNGLTPVIYYLTAIYRMKTTHGLCANCAALPQTERDARLTQRRLTDPRLPSAADLDVICAEREQAERHEQSTRRAGRAALDPAEKAELAHVHPSANTPRKAFETPRRVSRTAAPNPPQGRTLDEKLIDLEKRGPTGVTRSATAHAPADDKKGKRP